MRRFRFFVRLSHNGHSFLFFSRIIHFVRSDVYWTVLEIISKQTRFVTRVIDLFVLLTHHAEIGSKFTET